MIGFRTSLKDFISSRLHTFFDTSFIDGNNSIDRELSGLNQYSIILQRSLGKGEVESSILSSSTINPLILFTFHSLRGRPALPALQNIARNYAPKRPALVQILYKFARAFSICTAARRPIRTPRGRACGGAAAALAWRKTEGNLM